MKNRNIAAVLILSFITFGFYQLYWLASTRKELVAKGNKVPPVFTLFIPLFIIIAFVIRDIAVEEITGKAPYFPITEAGGVLTILFGIIFVFSYTPIWFWKYSGAVANVTNNSANRGLVYTLWLVTFFFGFPFIWPLIIQDYFNKVPNNNLPQQPQEVPPEPPLPQSPTPTLPSNG